MFFSQQEIPSTLEELLWGDKMSYIYLSHNPSAVTNSISKIGIISLLKQNRFQHSQLLSQINLIIQDVNLHSLNCSDEMAKIYDEANKLKVLCCAIGLGSLKLPSQTNLGYKICESLSAWSQMSSKSTYVEQLEAEINMMRRTIDKLNKEISQNSQ